MKKLLSLLLAVALLVSCATLTFAAEEPVANDFVGVINLYTSADPQHRQWNAVLHDNALVMMTPEDIAEIAGLTRMDHDAGANTYDFSRGSYRVHVDVQTRTAEVYVDITSSEYLMPYGSFRLEYIGTAVFNAEEYTVFPLEQMLYLLNVQWQCLNDCVYTFAPKETLWNIVGDYVQLVQCLPQKTDLLGTTVGDYLSNSFMFSMLAFGDEISLTTLLPEVGFVGEKTKQALLTMSVPCENTAGRLSGKAEQMLDAYVSDVAAAAQAVGNAGDTLESSSTAFELFSNGFAKLRTLSNSDAMKGVKEAGAIAATSLSTVADLVDISVAMTRTLAWTDSYLEQIDYLASVRDPSYTEFCGEINTQAAAIAMESTAPLAMAVVESTMAIAENMANYIMNGTPVGQALSAYNLAVAALSTLPEVKIALQAGDNAYNAMDLCNLSIFMLSQYNKALDEHDGGVSQAYFDKVRLTGSLLTNAGAHAFDKMCSVEESMNHDTSSMDYKLLYTNTATLRFEESAMYDPSLLLQPGFSNLYSGEDGGTRQMIPPEYVHDPIPLHLSACIGEYGGVVYCTYDVPNSGFVKLSVEPAEYDYISSFLFYGGKLYYSCKDAGTSDYRTALYRCNPDGSEQEKLFGDEELDYTTDFHISYGNLYPHGSYRYYNIAEESFVDSEEYSYDFGALPEWYNIQYVFSQADGGSISREKYDPGNPYQRSERQELVQLDSMWSRICGLTSRALYYQTTEGNKASLYCYDFETGTVFLVDSRPAAGSGEYFNW